MSNGDYLNYFISGMPPKVVFEMHTKPLEELVNNDDYSEDNLLMIIPRVSFIGLTAYFESFCKETAATIFNIYPDLLETAKKGNYNTLLDAADLKSFNYDVSNRLGSLITEGYDFGDAKKINAFFQTIFNKTIFSKDEIHTYNKLLADRNLIVHNGGTLTQKYLKQHDPKLHIGTNAYFYSIKFDHNTFIEYLVFLRLIVNKITNNTIIGIKEAIENKYLEDSELQADALKALSWTY
ncbi:MAG: hypothetical protein PHI47_10555 [Sulfuricurvum sp.]|uniref:hypothetical protein n=1 Tax=Sulfuricurvum sp. TaxID=2025608 RepID=UPI002609978A|nr:hypothetical protein [Sulfuricurvum sp.]MDD5160482.1 hypothetical protein [Sulfuricurvum sp.]